MSVLLKDLPKEELPRERLIRYGVSAMSNEELLSVLLRTGTMNISAKDLAIKILSNFKNITDLRNTSLKKLISIKGIGIAKATNLMAALELGKRVYEENIIEDKVKIMNSIDAFKFFAKYIKGDDRENFMVIYLDNQHQYITHKILFKGTINQSLVYPREIFKEALIENSNSIILMHNHPSGILTPSKSDDILTRELVDGGSLLGITIVDHLIVGNNNYYSYIEEGRLKYE